MNHDYLMMSGSDWFWGYAMMLFMALLFIIITVIVIRLLKSDRAISAHRTNPLDIIKELYAKGEIDKKEFEDKKKDLKD